MKKRKNRHNIGIRTHDLLISDQVFYHWATCAPLLLYIKFLFYCSQGKKSLFWQEKSGDVICENTNTVGFSSSSRVAVWSRKQWGVVERKTSQGPNCQVDKIESCSWDKKVRKFRPRKGRASTFWRFPSWKSNLVSCFVTLGVLSNDFTLLHIVRPIQSPIGRYCHSKQ